MVNYKEILRLANEGTSQRQIAESVRSSHHTVREVLDVAERLGIHWPLEESSGNEQLGSILFPNRHVGRVNISNPTSPTSTRNCPSPR